MKKFDELDVKMQFGILLIAFILLIFILKV